MDKDNHDRITALTQGLLGLCHLYNATYKEMFLASIAVAATAIDGQPEISKEQWIAMWEVLVDAAMLEAQEARKPQLALVPDEDGEDG